MNFFDLLKKVLNTIKSLFISGFITILPITATIFFIHFSYSLLNRWLTPIKKLIPIQYQLIPGIEFILITGLILLIGVLLKLLIVTPIIHASEELIGKIPFIKTVYSAAKSLAVFFDVPDLKKSDKKVILIQYPRDGFYHLAFQLDSADDNFAKLIPESKKVNSEIKYFKVFMPNSPNPASGYFFILPENEIYPTNLSFEEAIKSIVSCGIITPESMKKSMDINNQYDI